MDISAYGYVIIAAVLGMAIVFLFLWFLSGLMSLIRRVFSEREPAGAPSGGAAIPEEADRWLVAAAVAFLEAEERDRAPDPTPWVAGRAHHEDPWLSAPSRRQM